mgnify:CR=1 FL=1
MHDIKLNGLTGINEEEQINFSTMNDGLRLNIVNLDLKSIGQG